MRHGQLQELQTAQTTTGTNEQEHAFHCYSKGLVPSHLDLLFTAQFKAAWHAGFRGGGGGAGRAINS